MKKFSVILLFQLVYTLSFSQDVWTLLKETSLRGSISGSITIGYIFKTGSSEYYIVDDRNRQRVRVRNPNVKIFQRGADYKLIIDDFDEPVYCKRLVDVVETQVDGEFNGWEGETIFKLSNGEVWQQAAYAYTYHYAYRPNVMIYLFKGEYRMAVEDVDETISVKKLNSSASKTNSIIESAVDGEFKGWDGETIFKLTNGQIWQQSSYSYTYHYAYNPKVTIYKSAYGYTMMVDGVSGKINVKQLK